jgi:hydrogenase nickel incorporation protein HypA/HybF
MHELSIALSILDVAAEQAREHGDGRVTAIHLRIGPLSGVVTEALRSAFELAREGGGLDSADLVIEEEPLIAYCPSCAADRKLESPQLLCCPDCGTPTPEVVSGRALQVVALELES